MKNNYIYFYTKWDKYHLIYDFNDKKIYKSRQNIDKPKPVYTLSYFVSMILFGQAPKVFDGIYRGNIFINIILILIMMIINFFVVYKYSKNFKFNLNLKREDINYFDMLNLEQDIECSMKQFNVQLLFYFLSLLFTLVCVVIFIFSSSGFWFIFACLCSCLCFLILTMFSIVNKYKFFKMYEKGEIKI